MTHDDVHHLAAARALDALDPDETRRFDAHLAGCERCRGELEGFRATATHLAAATAQAPPPALRAHVLAEIAATPQERPTVGPARRLPRRAPLLAAAAVLAIVVGAGATIADLAAERDRAQDLAAVLTAPDARTAPLEGVDDGIVRVVWSPSRAEVVVIGAELPAVDEGSTYELWALSEDGPRSAGVFEPGPDGTVSRQLALPADPADGWGVTIEPVDGTPEPEGDVIFHGTGPL